jgi:hypothetical protein
MNTYDPIENYLRHQPGPTCMISFQLWQQLTGVPLPDPPGSIRSFGPTTVPATSTRKPGSMPAGS